MQEKSDRGKQRCREETYSIRILRREIEWRVWIPHPSTTYLSLSLLTHGRSDRELSISFCVSIAPLHISNVLRIFCITLSFSLLSLSFSFPFPPFFLKLLVDKMITLYFKDSPLKKSISPSPKNTLFVYNFKQQKTVTCS